MINICTQRRFNNGDRRSTPERPNLQELHSSTVHQWRKSRNEITVIHPDSNPHDSKCFLEKLARRNSTLSQKPFILSSFFPFLIASQACARSAVIWVVFKRCVSTYTHQLEKKHYLSHRPKSCFWLSVTSPLSWKFKRWHRGCLYHLTIETRKKEKKKNPKCPSITKNSYGWKNKDSKVQCVKPDSTFRV